MIFIIFIILIFTGLLAFAQYGAQPSNELVQSQVYAQNMAVWHQAAMLAYRENSGMPQLNCPSTCPAYPLNHLIWQTSPGNPRPKQNEALDKYWTGYYPMVTIGNRTGWQSFLLQNIDALDGTPGKENYVLTVFRGFSSNTNSNGSNIGNERGALDDDQFIKALSRDATERIGIGLLNCNPIIGQCQFIRVSSEINNVATGSVADKPFVFKLKDLADMTNPIPATALFGGSIPGIVATALDDRPAIMTRISQ